MVDETADNPWADAAARTQATAKSSFQVNSADDWHLGRNQEEEEVDPDSCGFRTLYQGMQGWHLFDLLMGLLVLLYGSVISSSSVATIAIVLIMGVGILLLTRAICGILALWTDNFCHRCGLPISAGTSPILAFTWFVLMFINLTAPGHVQKYLEQHGMLWRFLQNWENSNNQRLTMFLLGAFLLECARWQLVQNLNRKLEILEASEDARARERSERRNRFAERPWWFGRRSRTNTNDDPLTDSLLPVASDRDQQSAAPSWTFFGRPRRAQREHNNVREDASVGFASVQEDWASRTEEDPYWWSREEDDSSSSPAQGNGTVSWLENKN